jgi:hypothetical protein
MAETPCASGDRNKAAREAGSLRRSENPAREDRRLASGNPWRQGWRQSSLGRQFASSSTRQYHVLTGIYRNSRALLHDLDASYMVAATLVRNITT